MQDIDGALPPVVARGAREIAQRICTIVKSVFEYAHTLQILKAPSIITLLGLYRKDIPQPLGKLHRYREGGETEIGKLMLALEESKIRWTFSTSVALRIVPYLIVRPGELVGMEWAEVDIRAAEWRIPGKRMKAGNDHVVPLCRQALALLEEIRPYSGAGLCTQLSAVTWHRPRLQNFLALAAHPFAFGSMLTDAVAKQLCKVNAKGVLAVVC